MKRMVFFVMTLSCLAPVFPQSGSLDGRWLFSGVNDAGVKDPLLILEITTTDSAPEAKLISSSAPFEITIDSVKAEGNSLSLEVTMGQAGKIIFHGTREGEVIKGKANVMGLDRNILGERTPLSELKSMEQSGQQEIRAFRTASRLKDPGKKIEALEAFIKQYPSSRFEETAHMEMFRARLTAGADDQQLLAATQTVLDNASEKSRVMNNIAFALANQKRLLDTAESYSRQAVKTVSGASPIRATYLDTLGWILFQKGELQEAATQLAEANNILPESAEIAFHLAQVREAQGKPEDAQALYLGAYVGDGNPEAKRRLEELYTRRHGSLNGLHEAIDAGYARKPALFDPGKFQGQGSGKVVLAELFTGSECGPCQAADYAFDGLLEHYPSDVVAVLEYHLHIPGPDPTTNPDTIERAKYYTVGATPTTFFGGTERLARGGRAAGAAVLFKEYEGLISKQLGQKPPLSLHAKGEIVGDEVRVKVETEFTQEISAENLRLRLALAEGTVHFSGSNGVHLHKKVVRKLMGGPEGFELIRGENGKVEVERSLSLTELETQLKTYLETFQKERELQFKELTYTINRNDLLIIAFVQNEETKEVLNAVTVPLN